MIRLLRRMAPAVLAVTFAVTASAETPAERTARFVVDFDPGDGIALKPMIGHPDRRLALRLAYAQDPYLLEARRYPIGDTSRIGPEHIVAGRKRLAPREQERLFVAVSHFTQCALRFCQVYVFVRKGTRWILDFTLTGLNFGDEVYASILTEPIIGRFFDLKTEAYAEPTIIEPNNNGRPVFIWRYEGVVWDGRDWAPFCWHACRR